MTNLSSQPFLLSLRQEIRPNINFQVRKTLLCGQQKDFKGYIEERCASGISLPACFGFLKLAGYELCSIRALHGDEARNGDAGFYRFWSDMILDTQQFIDVQIEIIRFRTDCPQHLLNETPQALPSGRWQWTGSKADFTECLTGLYMTGKLCLPSGSRVSSAELANGLGSLVGMAYANARAEMSKIISRKKKSDAFSERYDCLYEG
jgi:hypothetical protein